MPALPMLPELPRYNPRDVLRRVVQQAIERGAPVIVEKPEAPATIRWPGGESQPIPHGEPLPVSTEDRAPIVYLIRDVHGDEYTMCAGCAQTCRTRGGQDEVGAGCIEPWSIFGYPLYEASKAEECEVCGDPIEPRFRLKEGE